MIMRRTILLSLVIVIGLVDCSVGDSSANVTDAVMCDLCTCTSVDNSPVNINTTTFDIDCSGKHIGAITGLMDIPQNIRNLDLSDNDLTNAVISPNGNKIRVFKLVLKTNNIEQLAEPDFYHVFGMEHLDLSKNKLIEIIGRAFIYAKKLKTLDLSGNFLRGLPKGIFSSLSDLQLLSLSGNPLHSVDASLVSQLPSLTHLDLSSTALSDLHRDAFKGCNSLQSLNLAMNHFETIPTKAFENVERLERLILTGNPVTILDQRSFWFPTGLLELDVDQMPELREVREKTFARQTSLVRINLSGSRKLTKFDALAFQGAGSLSKIDLRNNGLENVENDLELAILCADSKINLTGNPWRCDCHLTWMIHCAEATNNSMGSCSEPDSMEGFQINQLTEDQLTCDDDIWFSGVVKIDKKLGIALLCLGVIGVVLSVAAIIVLFKFKPRITWNRRVKDGNEDLHYVRMRERDPEKFIPQRY